MSGLVDRRLRALLQIVAHVCARGGRCHVSDVGKALGLAPREVRKLVTGASTCGREPFGPDDLIELFLEGDWIALGNDLDLGRPLPLSRSEALALVIALRALDGAEVLGDATERATAALAAALAAPLDPDDPALAARFELSRADASDPALLRELWRAWRERVAVEIDYYTASRDELTTRTLRPYLMLMTSGSWYVVGYDSVRQRVLVFKVERIRRLAFTDQRFVPRASFKPERYRRPGKLLVGAAHATARVRFTGAAARHVRATWPDDKFSLEPDGTVIGTMEYDGTAAISDWLLARAGEAEVLEPAALRGAVARRARAALAVYDDDAESERG